MIVGTFVFTLLLFFQLQLEMLCLLDFDLNIMQMITVLALDKKADTVGKGEKALYVSGRHGGHPKLQKGLCSTLITLK